ncbi:xylogen-like protein 11 [Camellia sinensis]|uniref:Bifunctional inhibitor/plant lipid transfer protein/seed storage helical domain-containing protein n=1 Tax=Camellia sinensis var. sinensis TaxID=542762 RepID=A0A4S4EJP2_CAMSN|nr:xylogen-like protein 11 [Camellia sinensis]THG16779.1 hypothetical protein TEA_015967 [Camellia sinensis var. sinensis]
MTTATIAKITIIVATVTMLLAMVAAQAPAAAPELAAGAPGGETIGAGAPGPGGAMDCMTNLLNMSDCLTYVEAGSNLTKPDKACCPELAGLVESNPLCLCQLLANTSITGIQIELNKALNLPTVCAVQTPPISTCAAVGYPVPGPMSSEAPGAGAPGPGGVMDCRTNLLNMSDCLTYVEAGSNLTKPDKACCPELAGLVESNPLCLCQLLGNTSAIGIQIELNKALNLPTVCAVETPPISTCADVGYPVPGPMSSEAPDSMSPSLAASGNSGNVASSGIAASQLSILVGLAIAFLTTPFF